MTIIELLKMFPDNQAAERWFEEGRWPVGKRQCPDCLSHNYVEIQSRSPMPYRCRDCRQYFSVRKGTVMEGSKIGLQKWALAIFVISSRPKGLSSVQLGKDLGVTQKTAWFLMQRIREAFDIEPPVMDGEVEIDETFIGGKEKNKHANKRLRAGRGSVGKTPVVGVRCRATGKVSAQVVDSRDKITLHRFVGERVREGATVYTDEHGGYDGIPFREKVRHGAGEYVSGDCHTNGIESFWALIKRAYKGTYHYWSVKHLHRYVNEFVARNNLRGLNDVERMQVIWLGMISKRLTYKELVYG